MLKHTSRHPKIQYWNVEAGDNYKEVIDRIYENGCFDTLCVSGHTLNQWDLSNKPLVSDFAEYARSLGFKVPMQVFPRGYKFPSDVGVDDAAALVTEYECTIEDDQTVICAVGKNVRYKETSRPLTSELLRAYAFRKCGEGFYEADSLADISDRAVVTKEGSEALRLTFDTANLRGYTIYVMTAHYYASADLFSDFAIEEYRKLIDAYADIPLNGIVLDEFKNMAIVPTCWSGKTFRERFYGKNFRRYFKEQTGNDLIQTMFEMRFCPVGRDEIRIRAINQYFDVFRHSTKRVETFVAEYSKEVFGADAFAGLHNTYHNDLQSDEMWQTCCNWWEVPREYAQTDEDIPFPVRMGIACGCKESLIYDMYYSTDKERYYKKAMRDACFGSRIHYHIITSEDISHISWDTANPEFLTAVKPYEEKIELLNRFDPVMPKMELLVVFGFPALCNWYPNYEARNLMDLNGKLNITGRVNKLWNDGYLNALAPSDAIADGRIVMKDGKYEYCGHRFDKLLYLYPQYSKASVLDFLQNAIESGYDLKIIGEVTHDFDGNQATLNSASDRMLAENADIPVSMQLVPNPITDGCILEDGSVVLSHYESIADDKFCTCHFQVGQYSCEATFKGVLAVKLDEIGKIEKMAAGCLKEFKVDGNLVLMLNGDEDYIQ